MAKISFLNIRENIKLLLGMQGVQYICDTRKELNAINKFTMEGFTPDYVLELIGKLIEIKRHAVWGKDYFWKGCAVNLSDVYAYRVKIETVYSAITFPDPIPSTRAKVENFQPTTQSKDAINRVSTAMATTTLDGQHPIDSWNKFLQWSKSRLTRSSYAIIERLQVSIHVDGKSIRILYDPEMEIHEYLKQLIYKFFNEEIKPSLVVVFAQANA